MAKVGTILFQKDLKEIDNLYTSIEQSNLFIKTVTTYDW